MAQRGEESAYRSPDAAWRKGALPSNAGLHARVATQSSAGLGNKNVRKGRGKAVVNPVRFAIHFHLFTSAVLKQKQIKDVPCTA